MKTVDFVTWMPYLCIAGMLVVRYRLFGHYTKLAFVKQIFAIFVFLLKVSKSELVFEIIKPIRPAIERIVFETVAHWFGQVAERTNASAWSRGRSRMNPEP